MKHITQIQTSCITFPDCAITCPNRTQWLYGLTRCFFFFFSLIDSGGGPGALTGTCVVTIHVTTVNLYAPVCDQSTYNMTVQENQFNTGDILLNVGETLTVKFSFCYQVLYQQVQTLFLP